MSDPLSMIASVVGVVAATAQIIRKTIDLIDRIENAHEMVWQIRRELNDIGPVIRSLEKKLQTTTPVWEQLFKESQLSQALNTMRTVCENFASALVKWTKHSPGNKLSFRDGFAIAIHGNKISQLMKQLDSCKLTVTMAMTSCAMQGQMQSKTQAERTAKLKTQEKEAIELLRKQKAVLDSLDPEERQLQIAKAKPKKAGDSGEAERVKEALFDVSQARIAISQFATVSEYVAKVSVATRLDQEIGKVVISELGFGAVGISNVDEVVDVRQRIGDVDIGSRGTGFVGYHNNVDHNAALANRWGSASRR